MMDGPHGLCLIHFSAPTPLHPVTPPFEAHERMRDEWGSGHERLIFLYTTDQYHRERRSVLVTAMCQHTSEEELEAAKQWLLDITYLRYAEPAGSR